MLRTIGFSSSYYFPTEGEIIVIDVFDRNTGIVSLRYEARKIEIEVGIQLDLNRKRDFQKLRDAINMALDLKPHLLVRKTHQSED